MKKELKEAEKLYSNGYNRLLDEYKKIKYPKNLIKDKNRDLNCADYSDRFRYWILGIINNPLY